MLARFFPPKWRLRIVVLEILIIAFGLVQFAKTFDTMTGTQKALQSDANGSDPAAIAPTQAEVQAQLVQMLADKYNKNALIPQPLSKEETEKLEAGIAALTAQLKAQTETTQSTANQTTAPAN